MAEEAPPAADGAPVNPTPAVRPPAAPPAIRPGAVLPDVPYLTEPERERLAETQDEIINLSGQIAGHDLQILRLTQARDGLLQQAANKMVDRDSFTKKLIRNHMLDPARSWTFNPVTGIITEAPRG